ncbi:MAG: hypothetical protein CVT64_11575 [Actinobacteria bacterium HGW-Actinobacteria-4]|nr:MAG: hypothetical protein CVT64_11575 [Actinobacteria bacterium HGW-Actinobacteria-4]
MSESSAPPAGWYADPQNPAQQRYWDGTAWTQHMAPFAALAGAPGTYVKQPEKRRLNTMAIVLISVGTGLVIIGILAAISIPIYLSQRGKAVDSAAKADVSTLGKEIATYFVDHDGPPPTIVVVDGSYTFKDGTPMGGSNRKSANVELGGQTGSSWSDWCVWVTATEGEFKDFEYSAERGLQQGRCGQ